MKNLPKSTRLLNPLAKAPNTPKATLPLSVIFLLGSLGLGIAEDPSFDPDAWGVRCWSGETRRWEELGIDKMTVVEEDGATRVTNTSGIHRHAHLVYPAVPEGDFTFAIELRGGYELGFLNAEGKDEMLYVELGKRESGDGATVAIKEEFHTFEISREGTRFTIKRNGRAVPLVHFHFDYGEAFVITLAIQDGESAEIRSASLQ